MARPYEGLFWANTQKDTLNAYHDRWLLFGAVIGEDDELQIVRHDLDALSTPYKTAHTIASQTGLHIVMKDTRDVVALKITDEGEGAGDLIQTRAADGTVGARLTSGGTWTDASAKEFKEDMRIVTETFMKEVLDGLNIYSFQYKLEPNVTYVGPEAGEFHDLTGLGSSKAIAPKSIASIALKGAQMVWQKLKTIESDIAAIKQRMNTPMPTPDSSQETVEEPPEETQAEPSEELTNGDAPEV